MKNNLEIALKISSDLLTYCHHHGATEYDTRISEGVDAIMYVIHAYPVYLTEEQLEHLRQRLNAPRQREVEHEYWELIGESEDFSELMLVGMSCDEARVDYDDCNLTFTLLRHY